MVTIGPLPEQTSEDGLGVQFPDPLPPDPLTPLLPLLPAVEALSMPEEPSHAANSTAPVANPVIQLSVCLMASSFPVECVSLFACECRTSRLFLRRGAS
jgi:hypothetical protein